MVAEPIKIITTPAARSHPVYVLFEGRQQADAFLERIGSISIAPSAVTFLQVAVNEHRGRFRIGQRDLRQAPRFARYSVRGAIFGGLVALLLGSILNHTNFLALTLLETVFIYFLALSVLGCVLGGALGGLLASYRLPEPRIEVPVAENDEYLVIVKTPADLTAACTRLAQSLGARKISY